MWSELDKLVRFLSCLSLDLPLLTPPRLSLSSQAGLPNLRDVLFIGNPIYDDYSREAARIEVLRRIPQVAKIDGDMVKPAERELASGVAEAT
jgi:hypothetical protein